jgi:hypothetical protein
VPNEHWETLERCHARPGVEETGTCLKSRPVLQAYGAVGIALLNGRGWIGEALKSADASGFSRGWGDLIKDTVAPLNPWASAEDAR